MMRIVLENLLGNAWKFTRNVPHPTVEFGAKGGDEAAYVVRDNGAGFDMAYIDKLFLPFQRLHSEKDFPGTGIGLATIHRVIERHGGRVWAEGAIGRRRVVLLHASGFAVIAAQAARVYGVSFGASAPIASRNLGNIAGPSRPAAS